MYRSIFANYYRILAGLSLALMAIVLTGCNELAAEKAAPSRPVLVSTVHYEAESPERSFVATIRPRIETDMSFRVPGNVAKRLLEFDQPAHARHPLPPLAHTALTLQPAPA